MGLLLKKDELATSVGVSLGTTEWLLIDQTRVNGFADCTLDQQFIHVDPEKAAQTPFGSTIAHGFLTLSLLSHFATSIGCAVEGMTMGLNYGLEKVRFLAPVHVGRRIRAHGKLLDVQEKRLGHYLISQEVTVEIEGEKTPALSAVWLTMAITA